MKTTKTQSIVHGLTIRDEGRAFSLPIKTRTYTRKADLQRGLHRAVYRLFITPPQIQSMQRYGWLDPVWRFVIEDPFFKGSHESLTYTCKADAERAYYRFVHRLGSVQI